MSSAFDELPQRRDEAGRLWVFMFGRWTPIAEPEGGGGAAVPAPPHGGPPPLAGGAEAEPHGDHGC